MLTDFLHFFAESMTLMSTVERGDFLEKSRDRKDGKADDLVQSDPLGVIHKTMKMKNVGTSKVQADTKIA